MLLSLSALAPEPCATSADVDWPHTRVVSYKGHRHTQTVLYELYQMCWRELVAAQVPAQQLIDYPSGMLCTSIGITTGGTVAMS